MFRLPALLCAELSQRETKMSIFSNFFNLDVPKIDPLRPLCRDNVQFCRNLQIC